MTEAEWNSSSDAAAMMVYEVQRRFQEEMLEAMENPKEWNGLRCNLRNFEHEKIALAFIRDAIESSSTPPSDFVTTVIDRIERHHRGDWCNLREGISMSLEDILARYQAADEKKKLGQNNIDFAVFIMIDYREIDIGDTDWVVLRYLPENRKSQADIIRKMIPFQEKLL